LNVFCESQTAVVSNCVVSGNVADADLNHTHGGGASGGTLNNCRLSGNVAEFGGGASGCKLSNCTLDSNRAVYGGGALDSTLSNCTLVGNSADGSNIARLGGGGANGYVLNNCIVCFNTAPVESNYDSSSTLNYSCTTPQPTNGVGNITNAPLFVNVAAGNLRLQSTSPCINTGNNAFVTNGTDLDGRLRIAGGTVDMGAYEF
jgi:hypothetical protein